MTEEHRTFTVRQGFDTGFMFWRNDLKRIYVLYGDGRLQVFEDSWEEGQPVSGGYTPPPGHYKPVRGFGKVWREHLGGPNAAIGWATEEEQGFDAIVQDFTNGTMVNAAGSIFVLYDSGLWVRQ